MRTQAFVLLSAAFHFTFLWSIFSLYFQSPVVHVPQTFKPQLDRPLADRVVFVVGDGLRADKLFQIHPDPPFADLAPLPPALRPYLERDETLLDAQLTTAAPFLRSLIVEGKAAWGISHTRVPTESRPGHVALLGGMYEDPSAVLKGWKVNPIQFDSVLNASRVAFAMGSPDIVPLFKAAGDDHVHIWHYTSAMEDFTKDAVELDTWVLDQYERLLSNSTFSRTLHEPGVFVFLHLLGLDTTGHAYRPHSMEYYRNIQAVDALLNRVVQVTNEAFKDDRTAFVFTADHGMSNIGNHGDGNPDSTRTPIVAWGSGILSSLTQATHSSSNGHDEYSAPWQLGSTARIDMDQADVAALATALLGNPFPGNSVGRTPLQFLSTSIENQARVLFANAQSIMQQFVTKQDFKIRHAIKYVPFSELPLGTDNNSTISYRFSRVQSLLDSGLYGPALSYSDELISVALRALRYINGYDWLILQTIIITGYVGWMLYSAVFVLQNFVAQPLAPATSFKATTAMTAVFGVLVAKFAKERAQPVYYLYAAFPCFFYARIFGALHSFKQIRFNMATLFKALTLIAGLELCVVGYFQRAAWAIGLVMLGIVWPVLQFDAGFKGASKGHAGLGAAWTVSCLATALFPVLPVEKGESLLFLFSGAAAFVLVAGIAIWKLGSSPKRPNKFRQIVMFQTVCMVASLAVTLATSFSLNTKQGLPLFNQIAAWIILAISFLLPTYVVRHISNPVQRIIALIFTFVPIYTILTTSYELLFLFFFSLTLLLWLALETSLHKHQNPAAIKGVATRLSLSDARRAFFLLFFIHVGFFATGNIASISSFYLQPVYRLVGQFMPFLMAALLLYKIFIPFFVVAAVVHALNKDMGLPPFTIFLVALSISDVLTLNFFALVTDKGSWLEIGQSISHFAIANMLLLFMALLFVMGELLMA